MKLDTRLKTGLLALGLASVFAASSAGAAVVPLVAAAGINNSGGNGGTGTHYHTAVGTVAGVDYSFGEEGRGVAEFNLAGLGPVSSASISFTVTSFLDDFGTSGHFVDPISLFSYVGNNAIAFSDFQSTTTGLIGTFSTAGLSVGSILTFDVSAELIAALAAGDASFGLLFDPTTRTTEGTAIRFGSITLNATTGAAVPEPESLALLFAGAGAALFLRRRAQTRGR